MNNDSKPRLFLGALLLGALCLQPHSQSLAAADVSARVVALPPAWEAAAPHPANQPPLTPGPNDDALHQWWDKLYPGNRPPLTPSPLVKLPIGSITPKGWLRSQLELEAGGMSGHLEELSPWCKFDGSAWASPSGQGKFGWEELPYWLKGYGDLGYVLKDAQIIQHARKWIDATLSSQETDGYFGPRANKTGLDGHPDLWPNMLMLNVLQSFYEFSGDERVILFMSRYLAWLNTQPPENLGRGYWPKIRFGDTLESTHWLYNRTGQPWLLDLGRKIHQNMARWDTGVIDWHNVNISQGFREPGTYYEQARDERFLADAERNYQTFMGLYGQFPGGGFAGDENCRPGFTDPRQGFETCGIVELMHSFEMLAKISGNPVWADRCEEIAFNSLPAALTPDLKALHYLTCPNQVQLDKENKSPGVQNGGTMFSYSPYEAYRCCQHNVAHGWPYFAEELWLATPDGGLCASLYAASEVTAKAGAARNVTLSEETDYPFSDTVEFKLTLPRLADAAALAYGPVRFPLYLRIPRWCADPVVAINGQTVTFAAQPAAYVVLDRAWQNGDRVSLRLPMKVRVRTWAKNNHAVSVDRGPLTFSLKIGERYSLYGGTPAWPEVELFPTTPWNYGLVLDEHDPAASFEVVARPGPLPSQPFTPETAPVVLRARARKLPAWKQDQTGLVGKLQPSPGRSDEPLETVTLIPMGAARLRISAFPVIGQGPGAHEWVAPKTPPVSASHCNSTDTVEAMIDGLDPKNSNDHSVPRFTWWDHRGSAEWAQYQFAKPREVSAVEVYWFDDTGLGSCRLPASWKLFYKDGENWKLVPDASEFAVKADTYNRVHFTPVQTTALRLEVRLRPDFSGGILQWKVK